MADRSNNCVKVYTSDGRGPIQQLPSGESEHVMKGPLQGVAVDSTGVVYVTESGNHCVSMFNKDGIYVKSFGSRGKEENKFWSPSDIATSGGNIYVADFGNDRVQVISPPLS